MKRLLFAQLFLLIVISVLFFSGYFHDLFSIYWWWDSLLHFLGGVWVAIWAIAVYQYLKLKPTWWRVMLAVLAIGLAWELFEYILGNGGSVFLAQRFDMPKDVILDVLGAYAAVKAQFRIRI